MRRLILAALAAVASLTIGAAQAQNVPGPTLSAVLKKGKLDCAVPSITPGFGFVDSKGDFKGLDVDTCKAVAAAVFGDASKALFVPLSGAQRLPSLQSGQVDMVVQTMTQTISREAANGLLFAGINYYDGQGFLTRKSLGVKTAKDLAGASVCVSAGSTSELNLADWSASTGTKVQPVVFERNEEGRQAYDKGRCDAYSTDASQLAGIATVMHDPDNQLILPDLISKEPLGPAVRQGDDQWFLIVKWTLNALIEAEELGITQANVDEKLNSQDARVRRLLGVVGDYGKFMALDNRWAFNAIKAVGNYGEIFDRNMGANSPLKMPRGKNALWKDGGLMYSAPIR